MTFRMELVFEYDVARSFEKHETLLPRSTLVLVPRNSNYS